MKGKLFYIKGEYPRHYHSYDRTSAVPNDVNYHKCEYLVFADNIEEAKEKFITRVFEDEKDDDNYKDTEYALTKKRIRVYQVIETI